MKVQCTCGAKYAFDITPEMARNPVRFVCPGCGRDSSDFVNQLVRQELAEQFPETAAATPAAPPPVAPAAPPLKISHEQTPAAPAPEAAPVSGFCQKHRGVPATEQCFVCHKPICPKCMELFGYFCSPLCKGKAEARNLHAPAYAGLKSAVEARFWRKTGLIFGSIVAVLVLASGFWFWYAWFGSVPHPYFSLRFTDDERAYSGAVQLVGQDQIVFLHGGTLARYDMKTKTEVWSQQLVTKDQIAAIVKQEVDARTRENQNGEFSRIPPAGWEERQAKIMLDGALSLYVSGSNVWVNQPDKLVHYDWNSGTVLQQIPVTEPGGELVERNGELQLLDAQSVTHINLASGEMRTDNFSGTSTMTVATAQAAGGAGNRSATGGLPSSGGDNGNPLDPNKVAGQAQNLNLPARVALPALLANASYEQRLEAALKDGNTQHPHPPAAALPQPRSGFNLIPDQNSFVQFSAWLLERRIVTREAMKAPPKKSALDGDLNAGKTADVANETLNEMQRNRGGDTISEDESRYQVTVHLPDSPGTADWTGEVIGPPHLFALKTVNVIASGKTIIVLDKSNKKLWQAALTYDVPAGEGGFGRESQFGEGPCVEHNGVLYVFDQAVLSAFDVTTGNARWRVPSVGVVGLFFDDQDNVYVNTTSGNPDDIKYARQIDITKRTDDVLMKIDPARSKILWSVKPGGFISYLSGKFIYTVESFDPNPDDAPVLNDSLSNLQKPPFLRIARIDPKTGRILWTYEADHAPFYVRFNKNFIKLVFKKEVQVLHYLTL